MRIGQSGAAVGQVVNHIATLQSDGNMFIEAGRVSNESNPISVTVSTLDSSERKTLYQFPTMVKEITSYCGHDGRGHCAADTRPYVGFFDFSKGEDYGSLYPYYNCTANHCSPPKHDELRYRLISDDSSSHLLTVERKVFNNYGGNYRLLSSTVENYYYLSRNGSQYVYPIGFDPAKNFLPSDSAIQRGLATGYYAVPRGR